MSISDNCVPDDMKVARVKPLYKNNKNQDIGNYRPFSILSVVFKNLEQTFISILKLIWLK